MTEHPGAIDLSINFECNDETVTFIKKFLSINKIGIVSNKLLINKLVFVLFAHRMNIFYLRKPFTYLIRVTIL